jgi:hypothetical protein
MDDGDSTGSACPPEAIQVVRATLFLKETMSLTA